jgi:hypothetical protein
VSVKDKLPLVNVRDSNWVELRAWLLQEIEKEKNRLCDDAKTHEESMVIRGTIKAYKHVLGIESRLEIRNQMQA